MSTIRVLLVDDHALVRQGFRALLRELGFDVVGEARDGIEALQLVERYLPNIVLMDIAMPKLNGLEATARIVEAFPTVHVIILSMHANAEYARRALRAGAAGYLLKKSNGAELETAIHAVAQGHTFLSAAIAHFIAADYAERGSGRTPERLTPRQTEILQLIAKGYTRKQVAEQLTISAKTFDVYRAQLMRQLDVHDVASLIRTAVRMGFVIPDEQ